MSSEDFEMWTDHHATLFYMRSDADSALFAAWKPLVTPYDFDDFMAGSNWLASNKGGAFRTEHLTLIRERINVARSQQRQAQDDADSHRENRHECQLCHGMRGLTVPHQDYIRDSQWLKPYPTHWIWCRCSKGREVFEKYYQAAQDKKGLPRPLDFNAYEARFPTWPGMMLDLENMLKDELAAKVLAQRADFTSPLQQVRQLAKGATKQIPGPPAKSDRPPETWEPKGVPA